MKEDIQYYRFLYKDTIYHLPHKFTGKDRNNNPRFDSGIGGWWTYHLNFHEYFNIVFNGILIS